MKVQHLIFAQLAILFLIGPPIAYLFGEGGFYFHYLTRNRDTIYLFQAYFWVIYAVSVLVILYYLTRAHRLLFVYYNRPFVHARYRKYYNMWVFSLIAVSGCAIILFIQNGFCHPLMSGSINLNAQEFAIKRIAVSHALNMNIYNVGLHIFVAFAMVLAFFFLKKISLSIITVFFFIFFATFSLAKSPMAEVVLQLVFVYLLLNRSLWRPIFYLLFGIIGLGVLFVFTTKSDSLRLVWEAFIARLFLGEFAALPTYFEVFENVSVSMMSLLPPYVQTLLGVNIKGISRIVMEHIVGSGNMASAGVANSFFVGSAYGLMGKLGIILSPVLVFINFYAVVWIFSSLRKNVFSVFIFGYLLYRLSLAMSSSIGYFVFSGIQIIMVIFLIIKVFEQSLRVHGVNRGLVVHNTT